MKELRVALFTGNYNHIKDGVSLTLNRLVRFLEAQDIPVLIFGPTIEEPELDHAGRLVSLPSFPIPFSNRGEYRIVTGLSDEAERELEDFNPTLVHIATPDVGGLKGLRWAQKNNVQVVASYHTHFASYLKYYGLTPLEFLAWRYLSWFYNSCTHNYVPSQSMVDELESHGFHSDMKIWARGVNTTLFSPQKRDEKWRKKLGFAADDIVVTFVSRLVWEKALDTYRDSVQRVAAVNPKVKALVVGDGPAKVELEEQMPEARFTGFLEGEDLARAYASSDVFFFPSHTETFGNVTLEAMSSGLPCLVADATGSRSLVIDGENGFWAEPENKKDFTGKLEQIVGNPELRQKMKEASRKRALEFEWDAINGRLVENYREALALPVPQNHY
ncbi:glycosyltransferase family 4 protein [Gracilimonas mengyeensis]|uniref:Glycosyltransferase involved in cell wall bisynthesis n=1 Tax=Gracilimonas mengyeensis TaxID=1302730 RepID=A0A521F5H4_9BACT|nr:glycosyltransferase family 1 protein [Gracilimonas mengyeensis]SMO91326.1 Glycosyltransferase involved in cell wall bisynthesis [Gracilimonas mengyeensis]